MKQAQCDTALKMAIQEFNECRNREHQVHFIMDYANDGFIEVETLSTWKEPELGDEQSWLGSVGINCGLLAFCDEVIRLLKAS